MELRSSRREFIGDIVGAAALVHAGVGRLPVAELGRALHQEWDMSWTDRITGKYRVVFDSPDVADGTAFVNAFVFYAGYREVYDAKDAECNVVIVLRGNGVHMAFNDRAWERYTLSETLKTAGKANPFLGQMAALRQRGATLLACNLATEYYAGEMAKRTGERAGDVSAMLKANLAPGVILQPSGVFAAIRAQQAGCSFLKSA